LLKRGGGVGGRGAGLLGGYLERNGMSGLAARMAEGDLDEGSFVGVSAFRLGRQVADGLCRVGDAESIIPPFTGNGMSMALEAAESALDPLREYAEGEFSWEETVGRVAERLRRRFARRLRMARLIHPFFFSKLGRRMLSASARSGMLPFQFFFKTLR